jgi:hypothetical protein
MLSSPSVIERALARFGVREATTIEEWRRIAVSAGVPISLLYHLLYRQRLLQSEEAAQTVRLSTSELAFRIVRETPHLSTNSRTPTYDKTPGSPTFHISRHIAYSIAI